MGGNNNIGGSRSQRVRDVWRLIGEQRSADNVSKARANVVMALIRRTPAANGASEEESVA